MTSAFEAALTPGAASAKIIPLVQPAPTPEKAAPEKAAPEKEAGGAPEPPPGVSENTEAATGRGRGRPRKPKPEAVEPAPATPAETPKAEELFGLEDSAPALPVPTKDQIRQAGNAFMSKFGPEKTVEVLQKYGSSKFIEIAESHWPALYAEFQTALGQAA